MHLQIFSQDEYLMADSADIAMAGEVVIVNLSLVWKRSFAVVAVAVVSGTVMDLENAYIVGYVAAMFAQVGTAEAILTV